MSSPEQLLAETRPPLPAAPGCPSRIDYEYRRGGTANLFLVFKPKAEWRHVEGSEHRTLGDFAQQMKALVDSQHPQARRIAVVLDNLGTHRPAAREVSIIGLQCLDAASPTRRACGTRPRRGSTDKVPSAPQPIGTSRSTKPAPNCTASIRHTPCGPGLVAQPWQPARPGVQVKLLAQEGELYVLAQSRDRVAKERAMPPAAVEAVVDAAETALEDGAHGRGAASEIESSTTAA